MNAEGCQAFAEREALAGLADVHRNLPAQSIRRLLAACEQEAAHAPRGERQHDVVDRAAELALDDLQVVERDAHRRVAAGAADGAGCGALWRGGRPLPPPDTP